MRAFADVATIFSVLRVNFSTDGLYGQFFCVIDLPAKSNSVSSARRASETLQRSRSDTKRDLESPARQKNLLSAGPRNR